MNCFLELKDQYTFVALKVCMNYLAIVLLVAVFSLQKALTLFRV